MPAELNGSCPGHTQSYKAYLLWLSSTSGEDGSPTWRVSIESLVTQEERHFDDLPSLVAFLQGVIGQGASPSSTTHDNVKSRLENQTSK